MTTILKRFAPRTANMKDILDAFGRQLKGELNCHALGTIKKFNPEIIEDPDSPDFNPMQTADVQINYSRAQYVKNEAAGNYQSEPVSYPLLVQIPVIILGGGNSALTFPIEEGDQCLVLFNDRDIDNWFAGARSGELATTFQHAFGDGLALVGFQTFLGEYDEDHALLHKGDAKVGVGDKVLIQNKFAVVAPAPAIEEVTLNDALSELVTVLTAFLTITSTATLAPQIAAAAAAALLPPPDVSINSALLKIKGLLE